ncbi:MAG: ABC transporter ATP-binding protein [Streptomyces sp.]|nr:ABC transporter ATP-binding protein [Streptomyces sp.]
MRPAHRIVERLTLLRRLSDAPRGACAALCLMETLRAVLPAATALATGSLITTLRRGAGTHGIGVPLAVLGSVLLANQVVGALMPPVRTLVSQSIDGVHRRRVCEIAVGDGTLTRLEDARVQNLIRGATGDPSNWTEKTPGDGAVSQLSIVFGYVGLLSAGAVVVAYSWWLAPAAVLPAVLVRVITQRQWIGINRVWAKGIPESRRSDYWAELTSSPAEAREMRLFGFGDWTVRRQQRHRLNHFEPAWREGGRAVSRQWVQFLISAVPLVGIYYLAGDRAMRGQHSVGLMTAALAAAWGVFSIMAGNANAFNVEGALPVLRSFAELERQFAPRAPGPPAVARDASRGRTPAEIRFEGVTFSYAGAGTPVLSDLDLVVRPGEVLAVVGMNGAGKTTLIKLLSGLYLPTAGRITADGVDIQDLGLDRWRGELAVVFQDFIKYHFSAADNIAFGKAQHLGDRPALAAAVRDAGLSRLLDELPDGLDTPLSRSLSGGMDLSGGQWQQVALARALFALHVGATTLILDEPTAHLDVRTEFDLFHRLIGAADGASVILISHRLSTVREADRIVLLDGGKVAESGTHDELMALRGQYAEMFDIQARRFQAAGGHPAEGSAT